MKILVGEFITESNANIPQKCEISNYTVSYTHLTLPTNSLV